MSAAESSFDEGLVETYLEDKLGAESLALTNLKRNVGGMSRETWFAEVEGKRDGEAFTDALTIRVDHPGGSVVPVSLEREYQTFAALTPTRVPVAAALWYETDPSLRSRLSDRRRCPTRRQEISQPDRGRCHSSVRREDGTVKVGP